MYVCVCVYTYACVCMYACFYVGIYICLVCVCACVYVCECVSIYLHIHMRICICVHANIYPHYEYVHMCVYICLYIYTYIYVFIHANIRTYKSSYIHTQVCMPKSAALGLILQTAANFKLTIPHEGRFPTTSPHTKEYSSRKRKKSHTTDCIVKIKAF